MHFLYTHNLIILLNIWLLKILTLCISREIKFAFKVLKIDFCTCIIGSLSKRIPENWYLGINS